MDNKSDIFVVTEEVSSVSSPSHLTVPSDATRQRKRTPFHRIAGSIRSSSTAFSDWVISWTPCVLVATYYIVSTSIFVMCNEAAIKVLYFFFMVSFHCMQHRKIRRLIIFQVTNFYIAASCVLESFLSLTPLREARKAAIKVEKTGQWTTPDDKLPSIDIIIVAYLPNEKDIIRNQVLYAVEELQYPRDRLRVNLVYNTPYPIEPLETELHTLGKEIPNLRVLKAPGSRSKADNLNYFFSLTTHSDIIGIFDSDHCPHPHNPRWAAERFMSSGSVDIVQGRCIVYNTNESWYAKMIAIEFDKIYAISHPGRQRAFGFGLFCGSNGYWKADLLMGHKMDSSMLVEDIDSALRAYAKGKNAVHDMNVISYEMAPNQFKAFWKQRLRWAQGWTQASFRHLPLVWTNPSPAEDGTPRIRSFGERFGLLSLLFIRELSYYLVTLHTCLLLSFIIVDWPRTPRELIRLIFFRYPLAEWFFFATIAALFFTLWFTNLVRSEFTSYRSMIAFCSLYAPYLILMGTMGLFGHARQVVGYSSWNPTARK
nr:putative glycosyltransferase ydam [Quercus suber]